MNVWIRLLGLKTVWTDTTKSQGLRHLIVGIPYVIPTYGLELADGTHLSSPFSERYPQIRVTRSEKHHYIFYIHPEGRRPCIIAILHERMDKVARLKNRLD
jgi:hypothetical protein